MPPGCQWQLDGSGTKAVSPSRARVRRVASDHGPDGTREKASHAAYRPSALDHPNIYTSVHVEHVESLLNDIVWGCNFV